ncbi:hypothetical protein [Pedobacter cryotolerans]|uniref:HEAT repeat domain-containing protein n=1 Tax=Pedobacter cryotolerans TaxID=2571270 RepID=A0A4U1CAM0_9SPHI|nr:hypothetical protein [Pedobacter cryotolerans]TKC01980.1 hypothetical protein FA045_06960 [Pedobacter cryotolerans]
MKKLFIISFLFLISNVLSAQDIKTFKEEFNVAIEHKITDSIAANLINKHYKLLMWFYDGNDDVKTYPLKEIRNEAIYLNNIDNLFADKGPFINMLACLVAASTYDTTKIPNVTKALKNSNYKDLLAAKALIMLRHKDLDPIVKCIIAYNFNEKVQYLTVDFLNSDKNLLEKFACDSLLTNDKSMQYLAAKTMAQIPYKLKNEQLLRNAVIKYDTEMKGWPLAVLAHYKAKKILPLVNSYLENEKLREVCLRALVASEDFEDISYIKELIAKKYFDKDLMNNLLNSDNDFYLKSWLKMLEQNFISDDYYINLTNTKLIGNKKYFGQVKNIILTKTNEQQLYSLMDFFNGMYDADTKAFLSKCLDHPIAAVREKAKIFLSQMPN